MSKSSDERRKDAHVFFLLPVRVLVFRNIIVVWRAVYSHFRILSFGLLVIRICIWLVDNLVNV